MKKSLIGIAAVAVLIGTPALAADMALKAPPPAPAPAFSWTGFYIGADVGGIWNYQNADTNDPVHNASAGQAPDFVNLRASSVIGGAYAGYNYQINNWLVGIEGDWSGMHLSANAAGPNLFLNGTPTGSGGITFSSSENWVASLRARLGVLAAPNWLLYVTGGGAWTHITYSGINSFIGGCPNCSILSATAADKGGWSAGGGIEWAATPHWLFRAEYLHYGFNGNSYMPTYLLAAAPSPLYNFHTLGMDEGRVGVAYKF